MTGADATQAVCVIYGKNDYLRRRAVDAVLARELAGGDPALDLIRADGIKAEVAEVLDDVRTTSLLGGRRVVRVDDADTFITRHREILERYVAKPCTTGCLRLVCTNFDKRTRLYKAAQKSAEIIECQPIRGRALADWILEIARSEHGKRITPPTAAYLIEQAGAAQEPLEQ